MGEQVHKVRINLKEKNLIEQGHNRVYYSQKSEDLARDLLQVLALQEKMISDDLGIRSENFGVAIFQEVTQKGAAYIIDA